MTFIDAARRKTSHLIQKVKDSAASRDTRSHNTREADLTSDSHVANSRAGSFGEDGRYVGRTFPDTPFDVGQSGAEARSEQKRAEVKSEQQRNGASRHPDRGP